MYSKEVLVNEINGIINSVKFSRSYGDLYLGITFLCGGDTGYLLPEQDCRSMHSFAQTVFKGKNVNGPSTVHIKRRYWLAEQLID